jgi:hypothetical protein
VRIGTVRLVKPDIVLDLVDAYRAPGGFSLLRGLFSYGRLNRASTFQFAKQLWS